MIRQLAIATAYVIAIGLAALSIFAGIADRSLHSHSVKLRHVDAAPFALSALVCEASESQSTECTEIRGIRAAR